MREFFNIKKKKRTAIIPTKDKFWSNIGSAGSASKVAKLQTQPNQQETLIDLTDDNSPQVAVSTPVVMEKTIIKGNLGAKGSPTPQKEHQHIEDVVEIQERKKNTKTRIPSPDFTKDDFFETDVQKPLQPPVVQNKGISEPTSSLTYLVGKPQPTPAKQAKIINKAKQKQEQAQINKSQKQIQQQKQQPKKQQKQQQQQIQQQNPFSRRFPSGIPLSFLRQQEIDKVHQQQMQQQAALQQLQQEQIQQNTMQQLQMLAQPNFQPNMYPQQPIAAPSWHQPQPTMVPDPMAHMQAQEPMVQMQVQGPMVQMQTQEPMVQMQGQAPMVPMQYSEPMQGFNPTPQTYVPPIHLPDQAPQLNMPTEIYNVNSASDAKSEAGDGTLSPDFQAGPRLSAFQRLGPLTQPKKPKLTINLQCNKEQSIREVVDRTDEKTEVEPYIPVHLRPAVTMSTDETVMRFLINWPWKKTVAVRKTVTSKSSKSAMLLEREQMEEIYEKDNIYIQITIKGYPPTWKKEDVLDALLENIYVIPCFIEFTTQECKFLVIRCCVALLNIHKLGFIVTKDDSVLTLSISVTTLTLNQIDFIPRLILRKRLALAYNGEDTLTLKAFTTKEDISHFIYFPLNSTTNQFDLVHMQSVVAWEHLTSLDLSHNRMTSIDQFHLQKTTPKLRHLDLSHNKLEKISLLIRTRTLPLRSIKLEGNPLCYDYIDPAHYVKVVRMMYYGIREIDGIEVHLKGDMPKFYRNYAVHGAEYIVDKFLNVFFPLLDSPPEDRLLVDALYDEKALISITYQYKYLMRQFRSKPTINRYSDDGSKEIIEGVAAMTKLISKWPPLKHDPYTFTVDAIHHSDTSTIIKIDGILKITSENLAEDEHVIAFTRTVLLRTRDGIEYKIHNELLHWHIPTVKYANTAFRITKVRSKRLSLDLQSTPDDDLKDKLADIFMKITELDKKASERCLDKKDWNLRNALDYFIQLLKLDDLQSITAEVS